MLNEQKPGVLGDRIYTFTGRTICPSNPKIEEIYIEDIAHALSNICRFTGHVRSFYSVAQHSIEVSLHCPNYPLEGLLHDASEAYLSDIARPVKQVGELGRIYKEIETGLEKVIAERFGLTYPWPVEIKESDNRMLVTEQRDLMPEVTLIYEPYLDITIRSWTPELAKKLFLTRYRELTANGRRKEIRQGEAKI